MTSSCPESESGEHVILPPEPEVGIDVAQCWHCGETA